LPRTLEEALAALREDRCFADAFGQQFIDYYLTIKRAELARYHAEVTEWEQREYFELFRCLGGGRGCSGAARRMLLRPDPLRGGGFAVQRDQLPLFDVPADDRRAVRRLVQRPALRVSDRVRHTDAVQFERHSKAQLLPPLRHATDVRE